MRLTSRVHLVGSGSGGFGITDPFDCHVYLVDGGGEAALVDAGIGHATDAILARVEAAGVAAQAVGWLFLTHAHPDHTGGAAALRERLPGLRVVASPQVARWVRDGDEAAMSLEAGKRAEFYPADFGFPACPVDAELGEGDRVRVGDLELGVVETPGHAAGHLALLGALDGPTVLFAGDLVFYGGRVSLEHTWDCNIQALAASMGKLRDAGIDALLPGHHSLSLSDGQRHVDTANRLFDRGFVPPSVV
ncbi:MAG: MBL fold metallo-hydrolase [Actinomycetota bacterium]|nr:MBL fold metallo-hydrolase [Actinomycetota bacterium]